MSKTPRIVEVLVLSAAFLAPVASATAAPPTPSDSTETFAAGEACAFPISVVATGRGVSIDLPKNPRYYGITPSPGLRVTVTNLDAPTRSVTVNANGAFRYVALPDGGTEIRAGGNNLLYGYPGIGATALATTGPITVTISPEGEPAAIDVGRARVRDLCAELG